MSTGIVYEGPSFFASGRIFLVDLAVKFWQELATLKTQRKKCTCELKIFFML
jgi:hypothetical protein